MLRRLFVKDFVLIDECILNFENGFSAFTGETGAGKSLLIDAMCLLSGERASHSFIKNGASKAIVEGVFDLTNNIVALNKIKQANFPIEDNLVILKRELNKDGKSLVFVNNKSASLQLLKDIIQHEIDIHSQHDTQYLLNKTNHINLVDQVIEDKNLIQNVKEAFKKYSHLKTMMDSALNTTYNESELEFIEAEINEIEDASLSVEKENYLLDRQKEIITYEKSFNKISQAVLQLNKENGINEQIYEVLHILENIEDESIQGLVNRLNEHYNEIVDVSDQLNDKLLSLDMSENEINEVQSSLYEIQRLKRKYGPSIEAILNKQASLRQQIEMILNRQDYIETMQRKVDDAYDEFINYATCLSVLRKEAALSLQTSIENHLHDLMLPHAQFVVDFQEIDGNIHGLDDVEFYISLNVGEMPKPLSRVASGGELSRLMLGLKTIFTKLQGIQTVIFDEIDSGVSGAVASAIGMKMATLGNDVQVFSVTHLAQVAAHANKHYLVKKQTLENRTMTEVIELNEEERIEQIALISSGMLTEASTQAARELYFSCR